jgi:DNA-binding YbaB/EbfC family protein
MANQKQLNQMMKQVQKMQADMVAAQEALASELVEASSGGGVVKARVNGSGELQAIELDASVVDPDDIEMLQDLIVAAVTEASRKAQELQAQRLGAVTGGLDLGGLGGLGDLFG